MIPETVRPMPEPMRTLVLNGIKSAGTRQPVEVLMFIEEDLTFVETKKITRFLNWLCDNNLTVGHGTISLRWDEFTSKRAPATQDEAYEWAMKEAGV